MNMIKKVTRTNFKTFIKKHNDNLFIDVRTAFDGMTDCCEAVKDGFMPAIKDNEHMEHTFGIRGAWLVNGGRDYFRAYEDETFTGLEVTNCCGRFIIAVRK